MSKKSENRAVLRSLALISQFGITMLVPMALMFAAGCWLDRIFDTSFWAVLLFFFGALAGFQNVFRLARRVFKEQKDEETRGTEEPK